MLLLAGGTLIVHSRRGPDASNASLALIDKLTGDAADGTILVIGDSTGNEPGEWPDRFGRLLAARFPAFTISYRQFNLSGFQEVWRHRGTGDHTLTIDNASWGGRSTRWHLAPHLAALVAVHPDLIYVNHGHNDGYTVPAEPYWRDDLLALTESLSLASPKSEIVLIAQNPRTADPSMDARRPVTQDVAQERGYGFVNVWQAFHDAAPDGVGALLLGDGIHPNAAGSRVWAGAVLRDLLDGPTALQRPSSLSQPVASLVAGDFASGTAPGWRAVDVTTDHAHHEGNGAALLVRGSISRTLERVPAGWITAGVRVRVPDGAPAAAGMIAITEVGGSDPGRIVSNPLDDGRDGFMWVTISRRIARDARAVRISVLGAGAAVTVDRVVVAPGQLPRDSG